jgi:hypothetical protein
MADHLCRFGRQSEGWPENRMVSARKNQTPTSLAGSNRTRMTAKLNGRLEQLEEITQHRRTSTANAVVLAAFAALGDADLKALTQFFERLARGATLEEAFADRTPAEAAAIDSFSAESEAAALRIKGRPLSRAEVKSINLQLCDSK